MSIDKITQEYIRETIQDLLDDTFGDLELPIYIMASNLEDEEKEWADEHIKVSIKVETI